ncbi:MAG: LysR family transcriptional regulator, partial [Myxococcaceae bacterium]|nr:LysR family transcriptional regulator [Myxococcaceae bacterium]
MSSSPVCGPRGGPGDEHSTPGASIRFRTRTSFIDYHWLSMNLQRLEGFYWVARQQGYARAARAFPYPITQPGVHQQVRRLEDELGVKLFERVGKDRV